MFARVHRAILSILLLVIAGSIATATTASANCVASAGSPAAVPDDATVTCDDFAPDPFTTGIGSISVGERVTVDIESGSEIQANGDPGVTIGADGMVTNRGTIGSDMQGILSTGPGVTIDNQGKIESTAGTALVVTIDAIVTSSGELTGAAGGILAGDGNALTINNDIEGGTGKGVETQDSNVLVIIGDITSDDTGIAVGLGNSIEVEGDITSGSGTAVVLGDENTYAHESGTIDGGVEGFQIGRENVVRIGEGVVINATDRGIFTVLGGGDNFILSGATINAGGAQAIRLRDFDNLEQNGDVNNTNANGIGIFATNSSTVKLGGNMDVLGIGIQAFDDNAITITTPGGITAAGDRGMFLGRRNLVTIDGTVESASTFGIQAFDENRFINRGTILGGGGMPAMDLGTSNEVYNAGTIVGDGAIAIDFADGANTLTLDTGSQIEGTIAGGVGQDALILQGSGSEDDEFTGFETLTMQGQEWTLTTDIDIPTVNVESGLLRVNVNLFGDVTTTGSGTLAGDAFVEGTVQNDGQVSPGNSIGLIVIDGEYNQSEDGTLIIEVDDEGNMDAIRVLDDNGSGTATLAGTLVVDAGVIKDSVQQVMLADGGISGQFDEVQSLGRYMAGAGIVDGDQLVVGTVGPAGLDSRTDVSFGNGFLFMDSLSGRLHNVRTMPGEGAEAGEAAAVHGRLPAPNLLALGGRPTTGIASKMSAFSGRMLPEGQTGPGAWLRGVGKFGSRDADGGVRGFDYNMAGVALGGDYTLVDQGLTFGGAFMYTRSNSAVDGGHNSSTANNYMIGGYMAYDSENFFIDVSVGGGWNQYQSERALLVGASPMIASADIDGGTVGVRIQGGADFALGSWFVLRPLVIFDYMRVSQGAYAETGGGLGNVSQSSIAANAMKISGIFIGTADFGFDLGDLRLSLVPEVRGGVIGQLSIGGYDVEAALPGLGATGILQGNDADEVRGAVGAGVTSWIGGLGAYVDYAGEIGSKSRNHTISGGVKWVF